MEPVTKERLARYISLKKENENRLERLARMRSRSARKKGLCCGVRVAKNKSELLVEESAFDGEAPRTFHYIRRKSCFLKSGLYTSVIAVLNKWNTRAAPPIGRCEECLSWCTGTQFSKRCACQELSNSGDDGLVFTDLYDFCSKFVPKECEE